MFLDFHTHKSSKSKNTRVIQNIIIPDTEKGLEEFEVETDSNLQLFSAGIHPWNINPNLIDTQLEFLFELAKHEQIKLIGECGLDRLKGENLSVQEQVFIKQIRIAEEVRKPMVIHCVRCFSELLSINKIIKPKIPIVIHGYNSNPEIAHQLISKGFYLSFGKALLDENSNAQQILKFIPIEKLFLETDDSEQNIMSIYEVAAQFKQLELEVLVEKINENFLEICLN